MPDSVTSNPLRIVSYGLGLDSMNTFGNPNFVNGQLSGILV